MSVLLNIILLKYTVEEMYSENEFRIFSVPFVDKISGDGTVYSELFQYSDLKRKYKIDETEYSMDVKQVEKLIEQKFNHLIQNNELSSQYKNNYDYLNNLSQEVEFNQFKNCKELNSLQSELDDPSKLEHFTDWVSAYGAETGLWQQRFPKKLYKFTCLIEKIEEIKENKEARLKRIFSFSNIDDPLEEKRYFLINGVYYLENDETYENRIEVDISFDESEVFYLNDDKDDNPLNDDYFDEWYSVLILDHDPT